MFIKTTLFIYHKNFNAEFILRQIHRYYVYGILELKTLNYISTTLNAWKTDLKHLPEAVQIQSNKTTRFILRDLKNIFGSEITVIRLETQEVYEIKINFEIVNPTNHENKKNSSETNT